jgi:dolichol-phosphate mannosyltransferase
MKLLTIVMPARNEEANLPRAYDEVTAVMASLPYDYEVLVIDNDSSDRTGDIAAELCARDGRWRYLRFSRNFNVEHGSFHSGGRVADVRSGEWRCRTCRSTVNSSSRT